jgi:DNA-binding MarR family transcriptional regulator
MAKNDAHKKARKPGMVMSSYVPYQLAIISSRLSRALEDAYGKRHQLSRSEWRTLALLAESVSCFATDLVTHSGMDAVAVHRAVKKLEGMGLVARESSDQDRRAKPLTLTVEGQKVYEDVVPHALALEIQLLRSLGTQERAALVSALGKLMEMDFDADGSSSMS